MKTSDFITQVRALADAAEADLNNSTSEADFNDRFYKTRAKFGVVEDLADLTFE